MKNKNLIIGLSLLSGIVINNLKKKKFKKRFHKNFEYFEKESELNSIIISGGALGCLNYLNFLEDLEKRYNITNFVLDHNDLFTSNSGGTLIIFGIILGYTIQELKLLLDDVAVKVFKKKNIQIEGVFKLLSSESLFSNDVLKNILEEAIKNCPLNKLLRGEKIDNEFYSQNINISNLNIKEITSDNFTIDLLSKLFPLKIFNFTTYNKSTQSIDIFTSYEYINEELAAETNNDIFNSFKEKFNNNEEFKNIFYSEWSSIRYRNCIFKNKKAKITNIILASCAIPFFFKPVQIKSECFDKESNDNYHDGFIGGANIPILINNLVLKIINSRSLNNYSNIYNNMVLHTDIINQQNEKNQDKKNYQIIIELLQNLTGNASLNYTKALSYDNKLCKDFGYIMNNKYLNIKYYGSTLLYENYLNNIKIYQESTDYFKYLYEFKFDDKYLELQSNDYYRYLDNKDWIQKFIKKGFAYEKIKNETIFNFEVSDRELIFEDDFKKEIIKEYLKNDIL